MEGACGGVGPPRIFFLPIKGCIDGRDGLCLASNPGGIQALNSSMVRFVRAFGIAGLVSVLPGPFLM